MASWSTHKAIHTKLASKKQTIDKTVQKDDKFDENNLSKAFQQVHSNNCYLQVAVMVSGHWTGQKTLKKNSNNIHSMNKVFGKSNSRFTGADQDALAGTNALHKCSGSRPGRKIRLDQTNQIKKSGEIR